jgi:hypothetical protein
MVADDMTNSRLNQTIQNAAVLSSFQDYVHIGALVCEMVTGLAGFDQTFNVFRRWRSLLFC